MKTKQLLLPTLLLAFLMLTAHSCEKDNNTILEISPNSKTAVIQKEVDGIEFKFYLLNEQGNPSTVFNEGENFSFYFSVTNNSGEKLYFEPGFAYSNSNFCKVYSFKNQDLGQPFRLITVLDIGIGAYPFEKGDTCVFEQLWVDDRDSIWDWQKAVYQSTHKEFLPKGDYYTEFKHKFRFAGNQPINSDTLNFRINFRIK